jgi:hypothetical protein
VPAAIRAGLAYFLCFFAIAFLLGTLRELLVAPWLGPSVARFVEMPLMLLVTWFAAAWAVRRFALAAAAQRLTMGVIAFVLTLLGELLVGLYGFGMTARQWFAQFGAGEGLLTLAVQSSIVLFPLLQRGKGGAP